MSERTVLISGAGVAGPALAYWLGRYGFQPTVVERSSSLRSGGSAVDFRGPAHLTVLERMGVLDQLRALDTGGSALSFVDASGTEVGSLPADYAGGDVELLRGDLSRVLYERGLDRTEYLFGNSVATMTETRDGVSVGFADGSERRFDLVVGADGLHSRVRALAFGPEERFVRNQGHYLATWNLDNNVGVGRTALYHNVPGRMAGVIADHRDPGRASTLFIFAAKELTYDRHDVEQQRRILNGYFGDMEWLTPRLLSTLPDAPDLYFDSISRVDMPSWSRGRVVLLGDAGYGATLGGMGVGTGVVAAYVLAGELARADGDHATAFARYEAQLRTFVTRCQRGGSNAGRFLAPRSATVLRMRNWMLSSPYFRALMLKQADSMASNLPLRDYPAEPARR